MNHKLIINMRGFFRKERLGGLPSESGIGIAFRGFRREEGRCSITEFVAAFKCSDLRKDVLAYSKSGGKEDSDGEIDYYAYALLEEMSADIAVRVLNEKMRVPIGGTQPVEDAECDMALQLEGAVPLIWSDRCVINFNGADYAGGMA